MFEHGDLLGKTQSVSRLARGEISSRRERPSRKSLLTSLSQREEKIFEGFPEKIPLFPPLKKGGEGGFDGLSIG